jgi:hypothetical protein
MSTCRLLALTTLTTICGTLATGEQLQVSIEAFSDPTAFTISGGSNLDLRVSELVPAAGSNTSSHVLIDGLMPLDEETLVYSSPYRGIDASTGEEQDSGLVYLDLPETATLPEGTVSSPIVGVLQRAGSWSEFALQIPTTSVGGASGESQYDGTSLSLTLERDGELFTGSTAYTVLDENTIDLEPFTLVKDGVTSYDFSGVTLLRDGDRFYGSITNLSTDAAYDSLLFSVSLTDIPDLDSDQIPDISDPEVDGGGVVSLWSGLDPANAEGDKLAGIGWINDLNYPFVWHYSIGGYLYVLDEFSSLNSIYAWDYVNGFWVWTSDFWGGWHANLDDPSYGQGGWAVWE